MCATQADETTFSEKEEICRSGDAQALRRQTMVRYMRLDQVIPLTTLTHTLWRSTLGDFCVFYGLDVAEELQDAELFQHQGIMITARVLLCYFVGDAAAIGCHSRYMQLREFVESSMPQSLKWRLCATCQQATWCGTAVDSEMKLQAVERRTQIDRWARLSVTFRAQLPLDPCSSLS